MTIGQSSEQALEGRLDGLRRKFVDRSVEQMMELQSLADGHEREFGPAQSADVLTTVHRLSGSAGTFGFEDLSDKAGALEDAIRVSASPGLTLTLVREHLLGIWTELGKLQRESAE